MNDVTKDLLEALRDIQAVDSWEAALDPQRAVRIARAAIARAEAALAEPQPDALEQARAEEREACAAIAKEAVEGATVSKYATSREARAARGVAAHLLDAIRARGKQ